MPRNRSHVPSERVAVATAFLMHATVSGTWAPRLPAIKASLDLGAGTLGTALVGLAVGLLAGTRFAGSPVDRFGSRAVMRAGFPALFGVLVLPALAWSASTLFLALLALGVVSGMLDVAMNAQGVEVERQRRRPLLAGLHGLWSVGLGTGAGIAALAAGIGVAPLVQFAIVGSLLTVVSFPLMRGLLVGAPRDDGRGEVTESGWSPPLVVLGVVAFCSFVGEGSASDWSAVYLADELAAAPAVAALAFACFSAAAAAARFAADPLRARLGAVALVRGGTLLAAGGLVLGLVVHEPAAAIVGFTLLGAGLAPVVPIAFSAAGALDGHATGRNIGRVAGLGYVGSVSGPIAIGWFAQSTSLRLALGITALLALVIAAAAPAVGREATNAGLAPGRPDDRS
jgi:MFS family permease